MNKTATLVFCILMGMPSFIFGAASVDLPSILAKMAEAENKVQSLSFDFNQTTRILITGEEQKIVGAAHFLRPNKFRVEHQSPSRQVIVSNGKKLWVHNVPQNQVLVDSWENWSRSAGFPKGLTPFQLDVSDLKRKYDITFEKKTDDGKGAVLKMVPLDPGPWPYTFRVWVDGETGVPTRTELESQSVSSTTDVTRMKVNPVFAGDFFNFKVPEGAEILESPLGEGEKR